MNNLIVKSIAGLFFLVLVLALALFLSAGSLAFWQAWVFLADGNPRQLLKALAEVSRLDADCFVPGHGPIGGRRDLERLVEYVDYCTDTAQKLIAQGDTSDEVIAGVKVAQEYQDWEFPEFFQANLKFLCQRA